MSDWYKMNPLDWNSGTDGLSLEQEAAYLRLCHAMYITDGPIRDNSFVLCGLFRCNDRKAKRLLMDLVEAGKITVLDGLISNRRALEVISERDRLKIERRSAAARGGVESGKSRSKQLKNNEIDEANASTVVRSKNELDKIRLDKNTSSLRSDVGEDEVFERYAEMASRNGIPVPGKINDKRKSSIRARIKDFGLEGVMSAIQKAEASRFLMGENRDGWKMDFDFFLSPAKMTSIIEGKYENTTQNRKPSILQTLDRMQEDERSDMFDALKTIDHQDDRSGSASPLVRFTAHAQRY